MSGSKGSELRLEQINTHLYSQARTRLTSRVDVYPATFLIRYFIVLCISILCFLLLGAMTAQAQPEQPNTAPEIIIPNTDDMLLGQVTRVLDGDTLIIKVEDSTYLYQLLSSDAPEFVPSDRTPAPFSREAKQFIEQKLLGEIVYLQFDPQANRDSQQRRVVYLFRAPDMLFVNLELIRQGYAKYNPNRSSLHIDSFQYYAKKAIELQRGIWNPDADSVAWANSPSDEPEPVEKEQVDDQSITQVPAFANPQPIDPNSVYITKSGKSYHKQGCSHLTSTQHPARLEDIQDTHSPCKSCKPGS